MCGRAYYSLSLSSKLHASVLYYFHMSPLSPASLLKEVLSLLRKSMVKYDYYPSKKIPDNDNRINRDFFNTR
ncbi:MAG: hypothetical protein BWX49_00150 [Bacteroidetes bacterium ADurb.Bin008]|nr:MAG: hypothetical protein BWX49_00150 [Bacteroidetes bacterium ADurb.Bin008]